MMAKGLLLFCAQALLVQFISTQCVGTAYEGYGWPANSLAWEAATGAYAAPYAASWAAPCGTYAEWAGYAPATLAASSGGGFTVSSGSPIAPTGVAVTSENAYEGALAVTGALPFLGAVALEGPLPTAGMGAVNYGCGNGNVAILNEDIGLAGYNGYAYGPYGAELGYGYATPLGYEAYAGPYGYRGCGPY